MPYLSHLYNIIQPDTVSRRVSSPCPASASRLTTWSKTVSAPLISSSCVDGSVTFMPSRAYRRAVMLPHVCFCFSTCDQGIIFMFKGNAITNGFIGLFTTMLEAQSISIYLPTTTSRSNKDLFHSCMIRVRHVSYQS